MSVATAVYEETCKICETISLWFQKTIIQIQRGRQLSANREIINQLPALMAVSHNKELNYNLDKMNDLTNEMYDKKIEELENK
ncbi:MAG: hypothetical protein CMC84_01075 [Flavobacteriaceae bacterium]|nr:hypothetical protein [Flavobacteriaceae bacterium]|tara:strand:- start:972 stop:1220 length:249 start_codon:yes stop_codon:yes gene_type:complete